MADTRQTVIHRAIESYFGQNTISEPYDYEKIAGEVISKINDDIISDNGIGNHQKWRTLTDLGPNEVAGMSAIFRSGHYARHVECYQSLIK